ncbi:MAG TPA: SRPBCC domain-containing protein [Burkholderiaceae bacterium]
MQANQQVGQVSFSRNYPVAPEKVWRAWTDPQALSRWFAGGQVTAAEIDLREGGRYRIAFKGEGEAHEVSGEYQEVQPHSRLVFTWAFQSTPERASRISITLKALAEGGTEMDFVHDRFFNEEARANHERGWLFFIEKLGELLKLDTQEA